ncbi:hypothetical protein GWI33_008305 [Rhynchophorus ferrugineus]|uniref:C2H2-type domain-containing protein n=1 Tax=Rhynchophorus ferrugineus TaxID=354439 RepID=A0A834J291_RHYFE|nr:hypothetical protein GWI33_008305 [Rhynchophorus ferrugineus]
MFFSKLYLVNHEKHCGASLDKVGVCKCCLIKYPSTQALDNHYKLLAECKRTKNKLKCSFCHNKFGSINLFMYHVKDSHLKKFELPKMFKNKGDKLSNQIPCRFCPSTFKNINWAISHERKQHASEAIKCEICFEHVKMKNARSHYISHRSRGGFKKTPDKMCNICEVRVKNLHNHMMKHEQYKEH